MLVLVAMIVTLLILAADRAAAHPPRPRWLPEFWYRIGICETDLDWTMHGGRYSFAFGFANSTWEAYRLRSFPHYWQAARPRQQLTVARRVAHSAGLSAWGCFTRRDRLGDWVRSAYPGFIP